MRRGQGVESLSWVKTKQLQVIEHDFTESRNFLQVVPRGEPLLWEKVSFLQDCPLHWQGQFRNPFQAVD